VAFYQDFSATACPMRKDPGYQYHSEQEVCQGALAETPRRLADWQEAPMAGKTEPATDHVPVVGGLLQTTNSVSETQHATDLTGTILGYHASVPDTLDDLYTG